MWKSVTGGNTVLAPNSTEQEIARRKKVEEPTVGSPVAVATPGAGGASGTTAPDTKTTASASIASDGMSTYLDVSSNDMLRHKSLPSAPETLCGKIITDIFRPSALDTDGWGYKAECDICITLAGGNTFVNEANVQPRHIPCQRLVGGLPCQNPAEHYVPFEGNVCPSCLGDSKSEGAAREPEGRPKLRDLEIGADGMVVNAQAEPKFDMSQEEMYGDDISDRDPDDDELEDDEDVDWGLDGGDYELPDGDDAGTYINQDTPAEEDEEEGEESEGGEKDSEGSYFGLGDEGASLEEAVVNYFHEDPDALRDFVEFLTKKGHSVKTALNYTLDGQKIVDGFKVMLTSQEANNLPYLDTNKVTISEKITCSDCREASWLQTVASCRDCNEFKCSSCMESMRDFSGICRRCANTLGDTIGEESPLVERDMYFEYFLNNETESPLFLPEGE